MSILKASSLGVKTPGGEVLLEDVNLEVEKDEFLLVGGKPGSGKTLLCKALKGLFDHPESEERRDEIRLVGKIERNGRIGMVFQNPERSVVREKVRRDAVFGLENAGFSREEMEKRVERYADMLGVSSLLERKVTELSLGELTKVSLLGALVLEPDLIILDEPLSGLDYRSRRALLSCLDDLRNKEKSLMVVEGDLRELYDRVDRALLLKDGGVRAVGKMDELAFSFYEEGARLPFEEELRIRLGSTEDSTGRG